MNTKLINSPIGPITMVAESNAITGLYFGDVQSNLASSEQTSAFEVLSQCEEELNSYFAGKLKEFKVPVLAKGTPFREKVWEALRQIPYGKTARYRDIAECIGNPKSVRAVGGANHHNPVSIIIPCHRVLGSDGSLTGYGGGMEAKQWLLELEARYT